MNRPKKASLADVTSEAR